MLWFIQMLQNNPGYFLVFYTVISLINLTLFNLGFVLSAIFLVNRLNHNMISMKILFTQIKLPLIKIVLTPKVDNA